MRVESWMGFVAPSIASRSHVASEWTWTHLVCMWSWSHVAHEWSVTHVAHEWSVTLVAWEWSVTHVAREWSWCHVAREMSTSHRSWYLSLGKAVLAPVLTEGSVSKGEPSLTTTEAANASSLLQKRAFRHHVIVVQAHLSKHLRQDHHFLKEKTYPSCSLWC